jgi:hypothetical protein
MSQRRIKKRAKPDGLAAAWESTAQRVIGNKPPVFGNETDMILTAVLNAALKWTLRDTSRPEVERLELYLLLHSWGAWFYYAVKFEDSVHNQLDSPYEDHETAHSLLFGEGNCPLCLRRSREGQFSFRCRWHRNCLAIAYARDAVPTCAGARTTPARTAASRRARPS